MALLDELGEWTEMDVAALVLGRTLGVFSASTELAEAKAVLWTNNAAGNTLYGMLDRLAWLGVLECDEESQRYRAAPPRLHPLSEVDDVPALAAGPPARCQIKLSLDAPEGFWLEADRAGFRHLARVCEEIADSGLDNGWHVHRNASFGPSDGARPQFSLMLVDADRDEP